MSPAHIALWLAGIQISSEAAPRWRVIATSGLPLSTDIFECSGLADSAIYKPWSTPTTPISPISKLEATARERRKEETRRIAPWTLENLTFPVFCHRILKGMSRLSISRLIVRRLVLLVGGPSSWEPSTATQADWAVRKKSPRWLQTAGGRVVAWHLIDFLQMMISPWSIVCAHP